MSYRQKRWNLLTEADIQSTLSFNVVPRQETFLGNQTSQLNETSF